MLIVRGNDGVKSAQKVTSALYSHPVSNFFEQICQGVKCVH